VFDMLDLCELRADMFNLHCKLRSDVFDVRLAGDGERSRVTTGL
jgi:hypothetical protein